MTERPQSTPRPGTLPVSAHVASGRGDPGVAASVQDAILFTTDETLGYAPGSVMTAPGHIRCLREKRFKYALYFDPDQPGVRQYELYDLKADPLEVHNMAHPLSPWYDAAKTAEMDEKLAVRMGETGTTPA